MREGEQDNLYRLGISGFLRQISGRMSQPGRWQSILKTCCGSYAGLLIEGTWRLSWHGVTARWAAAGSELNATKSGIILA